MTRLAGAVSWTLGARYLGFVLQFAVGLYLARHYITPSDLGAFSSAAAASAILTSFQDFGLARYLIGLRRIRRRDLWSAFSLSALLACGAALLNLAAAWPLGHLLNIPSLPTLMVVLSLSALCTPVSLLPLVLLQRSMNFQALARVELGSSLASLGTTFLLAQAGQGALALACGYFALQASRALFAQIAVGGIWPRPAGRGAKRTILRYGQTITLMNSFWLASDWVPHLLIARHLGQSALGLFARAEGLALMLRDMLASAAGSVFYAAFARTRAAGQPLRPLYEDVVTSYCVLAWPALAGLAILADPIIALLYGHQWSGAATALRWVALSHMCFVALPLHVELPMLLGQTRPLLWRCLSDSVLAILLVAVGAWYGITAAAVMRLVFGLLWLFIHVPPMFRILELDRRRMARIYGKSLLLTFATIAPASFWQCVRPEVAISAAQAILLSATGLGCWAVCAFALRHPAADMMRHLIYRARQSVLHYAR